jgi:hypothetical protein
LQLPKCAFIRNLSAVELQYSVFFTVCVLRHFKCTDKCQAEIIFVVKLLYGRLCDEGYSSCKACICVP